MSHGRGEVWWGPTLHKDSAAYRPWLIVSDASHPFHAEECIVLAMTTQRHSEGIAVPDSAWIRGGSETDAYVSPWYVSTFKHDDFDRQQGLLDAEIVDEAVDDLRRYTAGRG